MNPIPQQDSKPESRASANLVDLIIRGSLIGGLAILCYQVFSPFLPLMAWSIILAVMLYPLHQRIAHVIRNKQWLASVIVLLIGFLIIIIPTALLMNSFADSVRGFISSVQNNTLEIPAPGKNVAQWPIVGNKVYELWSKAHSDLPGLVQSMQ
ncbi:MAG TPA: AI-2E family transporter, partial [Acidobacteriota bacterium]